MRIDYHKWKDFKDCPKKFSLRYVEKLPPTVPENAYHTLYGRLVEKFFETFCNIWRFKTPHLFPEVIRERLIPIYDSIIQSSTITWSGPTIKHTKDEIFEQAYNDVCAIMESHNQNYFLNTKSEVSIEMQLKDGNVIDGRIDFLHKQPLNDDFSIIDGKGSSKIGRNVSDNQLLFYTLLYYFQYKRLPLETGFFYYRFNTFVPVLIDVDMINVFRAGLSLDIKKMTSEAPIATPNAKSCKYCSYANSCLEGMVSKAGRAKKSKLDIVSTGEGITEFGF
jgi:CRISPR/Cas system-associated exonuclease Cas4 (RecB family)